MSEEVLEIFEEKINILKGIRDELLSDSPETEFVIDINDPKEKRQIVLNQIYDRQHFTHQILSEAENIQP